MTTDNFHERVWSAVAAVVALFILGGVTTCSIRHAEFEEACNKVGGFRHSISGHRVCINKIEPLPVSVP